MLVIQIYFFELEIALSSIKDRFFLLKVQVFYSIGALLVLLAMMASLCGICKEFGKNAKGMPSLVFWLGIVSCASQLIALSIYGSKGVRDYSYYQPGYSIIVASVALGVHFFSCLFFLVEICTKNKKYKA
jgi:hypothetical protein